jgi:hypothetical protein
MNKVIVSMRGLLEPLELEEDFAETAHRLNIAAAQGREFVATTDELGRNVLLKMDNILTIVEKDDEDTGVIG